MLFNTLTQIMTNHCRKPSRNCVDHLWQKRRLQSHFVVDAVVPVVRVNLNSMDCPKDQRNQENKSFRLSFRFALVWTCIGSTTHLLGEWISWAKPEQPKSDQHKRDSQEGNMTKEFQGNPVRSSTRYSVKL